MCLVAVLVHAFGEFKWRQAQLMVTQSSPDKGIPSLCLPTQFLKSDFPGAPKLLFMT
jgi:hypothetical protein